MSAAADFSTVDRLVTTNVRLAHFFAAKFAWALGANEALSIALEGLHAAAVEYDEAKQIPFGTYASCRIKWLFNKNYRHGLRKKRGKQFSHIALEQPISDSGSATVADTVMDENMGTAAEDTEFTDQQELYRRLLGKLPTREAAIITARFGLDGEEPKTLEEIAVVWKVTRERIRQLEEMALFKMAHFAGIKRVRKPRVPLRNGQPRLHLVKNLAPRWNRPALRKAS
jgi:RNA polymerase sigma factor (sigma-70 family)